LRIKERNRLITPASVKMFRCGQRLSGKRFQ
jgi:hypothetical protein